MRVWRVSRRYRKYSTIWKNHRRFRLRLAWNLVLEGARMMLNPRWVETLSTRANPKPLRKAPATTRSNVFQRPVASTVSFVGFYGRIKRSLISKRFLTDRVYKKVKLRELHLGVLFVR